MEQERRNIRLTLVMLAVFMLVLVAGFVHRMSKPVIFSAEKLATYGGIVFDKPRVFREMELVDHSGKPFNKERLQGKWTLVFFGFTYCPDICPTTMGVLGKLQEELQKHGEADDLQVVMVSVDPARDTQEKLKDYVTYFNPAFVGVTGEYMALVKLTGDLNAGFTKVPLDDNNYLVEHSGNITIINPRGDYHGLFRPPFDPVRLRLAFGSVRAQYERDYGR